MRKKRILIIAYYWPPFGGAGVFRIIRFAKNLSAMGYELAVLCPRKAHTHVIDEKLNEQLPKGIQVHRTRILEPTTLFKSGFRQNQTKLITDVMQSKKGGWKVKLSMWVRLNLFIPDAKIGWYPFAIREGKKLIKQFEPDVILSTSPPPTTSLIAKRLSKWSSLPWICDFRDPWTHIYYYDDNPRSSWANSRNKRMEKEVLEAADHITLVSDGFFPDNDIKSKSTIITNGFDPDEMELSAIDEVKGQYFSVCYLGTMKVNQFSRAFFQSVRELCEELPEFKSKLKIEFYGTTVQVISDYIHELDLEDLISIKEFVPRKKAIDLLFKSDVLFLIVGKSNTEKYVYSTKLFEYISSGNAVLGLGPVDGVAAQVLEHTSAGKMHDREDKEGIKSTLRSYFNRWQKGQILEDTDKSAIEDYSFRSLTRKLSDIIQHV